MSHVFHRDLRRSYPVAEHGEGIFVIDREGKRYLDACGGAAVSCLGHSHPRVLEAMRRQIDRLCYAHTSFFTSEPAEALADRLIADAPGGFGSVYFVSGGSEGIEAALKMARQYFLEIGQPKRSRFIGRRQSYHGNTLGALAVGGNAWRRAQFAPLLVDTTHVSPCYEYRERWGDETPEQYGERLAVELEQTIWRLGPETVIAFVVETVGGATSGCIPPVPGYFRRVREICDRHGVLLIADEVMCGMGRTGTLYAFEQEAVIPDLVVIAKGLGGGYQPIGAVLAQPRIVESFRAGTGFFQHGHTYLAHILACAAALAVQDAIRDERLLERVSAMGEHLAGRLRQRFAEHPAVGDIRGRGLFRAIELVADRGTKAPFDPALKLHALVKAEAMRLGLMVYPMGGTIDGKNGDHVMVAPPFLVDEAIVDEIVDRLGSALDAALERAGARSRPATIG